MPKERVLARIESQFGRPFQAIATEHLEAGGSQADLARYLKIPYVTLRYLLLREGARVRRTVRFLGDESANAS